MKSRHQKGGLCTLEKFSERLRATRKAMKLNQEQFAGLGGVCKTTQIHYEAGRQSASVRYLFALADRGVDVAYLITGGRDATVLAPQESELISLIKAGLHIEAARRLLEMELSDQS